MKMMLIHGRKDPNEDMQDWGFNGPVLDRIAYVHGTYGDMTIGFETAAAAKAAHGETGWVWADDTVLAVKSCEDMVMTHDPSTQTPSYFGDWEFMP